MPILLYRVDERLIHGQVVVGWGSLLRPERYLVVDDVLAESEWEKELYVLSVPDGVVVEFASSQVAREEVADWRDSETKSLLLTRDIETMARLAGGGLLEGEEVNLGGIHFKEGRREALPYIYLDESDREALRELAGEGVEVSARNLPGSPRVSLPSLLA